MASGIKDGEQFTFHIPLEYENCTVLEFIYQLGRKIAILNLSSILDSADLKDCGDSYELEVTKEGRHYVSGKDRFKEESDFSTRLD